MKRRDLEKWLRNHGCEFLHAGGNHDIWVNSESGKRGPVPRHKEIKTATGRNTCKLLGIPNPPFK